MRVAAGEQTELNRRIIGKFAWSPDERIEWLSPVKSDQVARYYDEAFLKRLKITGLKVPLRKFWPSSGPRWDGLARTDSGKMILVEAKAHIDECIDLGSRAKAESARRIAIALEEAKKAFHSSSAAPWGAPFYQYANRLAHLHFLHGLNGLDAYLVFLYFADAPDVPKPCSEEQWEGAIELTKKCLGLGAHPYRGRVASIITPPTVV